MPLRLLHVLAVALHLAACAAPLRAPTSDLTPWDDVADDGAASAALLAAIAPAVAADSRTSGTVVVRGVHARNDLGMFIRTEVHVTTHRPDQSERCTTGAAVVQHDDGWHVVHVQRFVDDVVLDPSIPCADAMAAVDIVVAIPEVSDAHLRPVWVGHGAAHGQVSRPTCVDREEIAVELERPNKARSDLHAVGCVMEGKVRITSWTPLY